MDYIRSIVMIAVITGVCLWFTSTSPRQSAESGSFLAIKDRQ